MRRSGNNSPLFWGGILIIFGILFLLDNFYILDFGDIISTYWPLILVVIGVKILLDHRRQGNEEDNFKPEEGVNSGESNGQMDRISESNVFGDIFLNIVSENFQGGSVSNVFGDIKLDFSKARLREGTTKIFISGVFGDVTIIAPKDIPLKTRNSSVAGDISVRGRKKEGIFPKMDVIEDSYERSKSKLSISVSIVFGSISIN